MTPAQRLERIRKLRADELDRRMAEVAAADRRERDAREIHEQARARTECARAERSLRARTGTSAEDWSQLELWLAELGRRERVASEHAAARVRESAEARGLANAARIELEKIEKLKTRLASEQALAERRSAQKIEDELTGTHVAAAMAAEQRERRRSGGGA